MFMSHPPIRMRVRAARGCLLLAMGFAASFNAAVANSATDELTLSGSPSTSVVAQKTYTFTPKAVDSLDRRVWFRVWNKPTWATFSSHTGTLTGTPRASPCVS